MDGEFDAGSGVRGRHLSLCRGFGHALSSLEVDDLADAFAGVGLPVGCPSCSSSWEVTARRNPALTRVGLNCTACGWYEFDLPAPVPPYEVPLTRPSEEGWDEWEAVSVDRLLDGFSRERPADVFKGAPTVNWKCLECGKQNEFRFESEIEVWPNLPRWERVGAECESCGAPSAVSASFSYEAGRLRWAVTGERRE
jgi:hypothetical protein